MPSGVSNGPSAPALVAAFEAEQAAALARLGDTPLSEVPSLAAWRRAFRAFGTDPTGYRSAAEALLRRLTKQGSIPSINTLVDIGNLVSIRYALPVAMFDRRLDRRWPDRAVRDGRRVVRRPRHRRARGTRRRRGHLHRRGRPRRRPPLVLAPVGRERQPTRRPPRCSSRSRATTRAPAPTSRPRTADLEALLRTYGSPDSIRTGIVDAISRAVTFP